MAGGESRKETIMFPRHHAGLAFAILLAVASPATAEGDAVLGKKVFNRCAACHDARAEKDKVGPHLVGVLGRTAGTLESFAGKYSDAMVVAGEGGLVWDDTTLAAFLHAPNAYVEGNKMAFAGLEDDEAIANLLAFLKADPKP